MTFHRWPAVTALAIVAACSAPHVASTEQEAVYTTPSSWDFGSVPLGSSSAPRQITVGVNLSQNEYHTITNVYEACDDFTLDLSTLGDPATIYRECEACPTCAQAASAICTTQQQRFDVTFSPTVPGTQACTITIELDDGVKYLTVNGTGEQPEYLLTLLAPISGSLAFGDVIVGQTSAGLPVTVRNDGSMPIDVASVELTGGGTTSYGISNGGNFQLVPSESRTLTIQCAPQAEGAANDTLRIASNDPSSPLDIPLTCAGIVSNLAITPSPAQLPEILVDETTFIDVTLANVGGADMTIDSATVTPATFSVVDLAGVPIAAGGSTTARVTFDPDDADADTDVQGMLTVNYDGGQTRTIDIVAPVRTSILSVSPGGEVDFGTVCGGQSARQLFAAVNLGTRSFDVESATVEGVGFALTLQPASYPVALQARAGNTVAFEITAAPTASGEATGALTLVPANSAIGTTVVDLRAVGQAGGVGASPTVVELDTVQVGESSGGRAVELTNCESSPLAVTSVAIFGRDAAEFTAVSDLSVPGSIAAFDSATWLIELRPQSRGEKIATLQIMHASGTTTIALSGAGDDGTDEEGRGSYYACDAGGASGAALVLLVMAALAWLPRRRRS